MFKLWNFSIIRTWIAWVLCLRIEIMLHNFGTHCDGSMDHHHYTTQSPKKATAFSLLSRRGERRTRRVNYISHFPPVLSLALSGNLAVRYQNLKREEREPSSPSSISPYHCMRLTRSQNSQKGKEPPREHWKEESWFVWLPFSNERRRLRRGNPALLLFLIMDQ